MLINSLTDTLCKHLTQRDPKYIYFISRDYSNHYNTRKRFQMYYMSIYQTLH